MSRHLPEKLFSGQLGNRFLCPSKDFAYLLQAVVRAGEQSQVDKAVFSLNGNSGFHQIRIGMIEMTRFSDASSVQSGKKDLKKECHPRLDQLAEAVLL